MINVKENLIGEIYEKNTVSGGINVGVMFVSPPLIDLEVNPSKEEQVFKHENSYGYDNVTVKAIGDEYVIPNGILEVIDNGIHNVKNYEDVNVNVKTEIILQDKEITPNKNIQIINSDEEFDGLNQVTINPIPGEYIIPSGIKEINSNGIHNVNEYKSANVNIEFIPNLQNKSITITENGTQNIVADEGYDGLNSVEVTTNVKSTSNEIKNLEELNNAIIGCVDNLLSYQTKYINQYECDSDEAITLYTPVEGFNHYITRYRNNGYQVLWFADRMIKERNSQNVTELNTRRALVYSFEFDTNDKVGISNGVTSIYADGNSTAYLSPTYLTLEELFNAMQDRTTIYTKTNNSGWGCDNRTPTLAPYTNMVYFDSSDNMVMKKRISSNEKIEVQ